MDSSQAKRKNSEAENDLAYLLPPQVGFAQSEEKKNLE